MINIGNIIKIIGLITYTFSQYYELDIEHTGQSHLVIFQESIQGIENGWEIGVFDQYGLVNDGNCETEYDDLLVASEVWQGDQMSTVAIGSIDYCEIDGFQESGYVENNQIYIRVYDPENNIEYSTNYITSDDFEAFFSSSFYTVISDINLEEILDVNCFNSKQKTKDFSISKLYPNPANPIINISFKNNLNQNLSFAIIGLNGDSYLEFQNYNYSVGYNMISIDLNEFSSGVYFLVMKNSIQRTYKKFLVLK